MCPPHSNAPTRVLPMRPLRARRMPQNVLADRRPGDDCEGHADKRAGGLGRDGHPAGHRQRRLHGRVRGAPPDDVAAAGRGARPSGVRGKRVALSGRRIIKKKIRKVILFVQYLENK